MSSFDVLISTEVLDKLKRDYEELKKENEELKKRLESYEKRPREESQSYLSHINRVKDYSNWIKGIEEEMS